MCGIVGLISKYTTLPSTHDELFTNLVRFDSIRGSDSTGVFGVTTSGQIDCVKGNADGFRFTMTTDFETFAKKIGKHYAIVIGHNRKATRGKISPENAHPFREKHIILVHNGVIRNSDSLNKEVEVDSHAIAHALAENVDASEALGKLDGAFSLVWFDQEKKTLNLARNDERPLFLIEYPSYWIISSEYGLPIWLRNRENQKHDKLIQVPPDKILIFPLESLNKPPQEVPYEEYSTYVNPVFSTPNYASNSSSPGYNGPRVSSKPLGQPVIAITTGHGGGVLKTGATITMRLDDYEEAEGTSVLLGHPVFDNYVDENIVVRAVLPRDSKISDYIDKTLWQATIINIRTLSGIPILYVNRVESLPTQNLQADDQTLSKAMLEGCPRCTLPLNITPTELMAKGIAQKRSNGTWRILCPECLTYSIKQAREQQATIDAKGDTPSVH